MSAPLHKKLSCKSKLVAAGAAEGAVGVSHNGWQLPQRAPTAEAFVFTAPTTVPFRGSNSVFYYFSFMSTEQLVNDLNGLDALLAHMLPTLEMRDVEIDKMPFECISSPSIFMHALQELHDAFHAQGIDAQVKKTLHEAFTTNQFKKQEYTGHRFSIPNAGNYTGKKWVQKVAPHNGGIIIKIEKPNAIKQTDLELSLLLLLEKVAVFTEQRLEISKMLCAWWMTMHQNAIDARKAAWRPELAGKPAPSSTFITIIRENCGKPMYYVQAEFDKVLLAYVNKIATCKENFRKYELEHIRVATQDLRERMLLLAQCSPTMQMALREGVGEPRMQASVGGVRVLWEKELLCRYSSKHVHSAQENTPMNDQSIVLKEMQAKMDAQEQAQNEKIASLSAQVALQKKDLENQAGKIYSIQHGMFAHFQKVIDKLADKVFICESTPPRGADGNRPNVVKVNTKMKLDTDPLQGLCPALIQDGRIGAGAE